MATSTPYLAMLLVQVGYLGSHLITKAALEDGMSFFIFIAYRHVIATLMLGPVAYFLERKRRPKFSLKTNMKIFVLALCGATIQQNFFYAALEYATPTLVSALLNVIPAFTFAMALLLGLEKLSFNSAPGLSKLVGTTICIAGALIFILWEGISFHGLKVPLIKIHGKAIAPKGARGWIMGSVFTVISDIAFSAGLILQAFVYVEYPSPLSLTALTCLFASIQGLIVALAFERRVNAWRIGWNIQLFSIIYCGIVNSILIYCIQTWCIDKKGPVFVSMFLPIQLVATAVASFLLFSEQLHLGSVVGAVVMIVGFYCVIWGKSKDPPRVQVPEEEQTLNRDDDPNITNMVSLEIQQMNVLEIVERRDLNGSLRDLYAS